MSTRPVLGISACNQLFAGETAQVVIDRYITTAMRYADVAALVIPALPDLMRAEEVAPRLDGLLLTGSPSNVDFRRYGAETGNGPFDQQRDAMSMAVIDAMIAQDKPVFGICRGFQEINVAFGGSLDGRYGDKGRELCHHAGEGATLDDMFGHRHPVSLTPGGLLANAFGRGELEVNSVHFQGIDRLGTGLSVEAVAPDGVIEAISAWPGKAPVLAVQWHPEWQIDRDAASRGFFGLVGRALRGEMDAAAKADC